jgi:hypothetical protein
MTTPPNNLTAYWCPEDYIYDNPTDCLLNHPEQAAQLMRDDSVYLAYQKAVEALRLYIGVPGKTLEGPTLYSAAEKTLKELGEM